MTIISQRELRNDSGRVMDRVEHGEKLTITRHGVPVAELVPVASRRTFVPTAAVSTAFRGLDRVDYEAMRSEADEFFSDDGDRV